MRPTTFPSCNAGRLRRKGGREGWGRASGGYFSLFLFLSLPLRAGGKGEKEEGGGEATMGAGFHQLLNFLPDIAMIFGPREGRGREGRKKRPYAGKVTPF